jgi:hypothetical protein
MRYFMLSLAAATMLGLGAAQAAQPAMRGHQPGAEAHQTPTDRRTLAEGDGSGADVQANPNFHGGATRHA